MASSARAAASGSKSGGRWARRRSSWRRGPTTSSTPRNGYVDERLVAEYRFTRAGGGLDLGIAAGRHAEVRLGVDVADVKGRIRIGSPLLPEVDGTEKFSSLSFVWDNQTSPVVPSKGHYVKSRLRYFFGAPEQTGGDRRRSTARRSSGRARSPDRGSRAPGVRTASS